MRKAKMWRVRVRRAVEEWVGVQADDILHAERLAATLPGVLSVLTGSTMRGDRPVAEVPPIGVVDDEE